LGKILAVCPDNLLPHSVIDAFSGIRSAEIERLDWRDILWDRGFIEVKAAKAKTKARRLVPLLPNLRAWLEPMKKTEGHVCFVPNVAFRLNYHLRRRRAQAPAIRAAAEAAPLHFRPGR
jgi:integrase